MKPISLLALALLVVLPTFAWAKRSPPEKVAPVKAAGVEYRVNHDQMGCVEAWDTASQQLVWRKQIYVVRYDVDLERDVQDVFITSVSVKGEKLLIKNERGSEYELDLAKLQVAVVKGKLIESVKR